MDRVKSFVGGFITGIGAALAVIVAWLRREIPQSGRYKSEDQKERTR
jgi:hypothetical protein